MTAKIKIVQYVIFIEPRKFNTADIKCYIIILELFASASRKRGNKIIDSGPLAFEGNIHVKSRLQGNVKPMIGWMDE